MRYSWSKSSNMKNKSDVVPYNEEVFRREFEKAVNDDKICGAPLKKGKRYRSAFTTEQVTYLEKEFKKYPYIGNARRKDVSNVLNIPERAVKIWFQNRRMKEKKDTTKESEEKNVANNNNNQPNNAYNPTSISNNMDTSLPSINAPARGLVKDKAETNISRSMDLSNTVAQSTNNPNYYKDISTERAEVNKPTASNITTVIKNNPASVVSSRDFSMDLLKPYKTGQSDTEDRKIDVLRTSPQSRQQSSLNQEIFKPEHMSNGSFAATPILPEDLSKGSQLHKVPNAIQSPNVDMKLSSTEMPVYLKGFYAQPYLPPGNMIWKPVNVAPIIPTPIPAMAVPSSSNGQNIVKKNCNCDCHLKPEPMFRYFQNNPNLQYVITAVPFQNAPPKF